MALRRRGSVHQPAGAEGVLCLGHVTMGVVEHRTRPQDAARCGCRTVAEASSRRLWQQTRQQRSGIHWSACADQPVLTVVAEALTKTGVDTAPTATS